MYENNPITYLEVHILAVIWCMKPTKIITYILLHDDVIKWKHFPWYRAICAGNSPVNSPHKGQWRGAFMFSLICAWINRWVNNGEAGDLRRYRAHYDVIAMQCKFSGTLAVELTKSCNKTSICICYRSTSSTNIIIVLRTTTLTMITTSRSCIFEGNRWLSDYHGCMTYTFVELWMCICMSIKYILHML